MATTITTKTINLEQLGHELGDVPVTLLDLDGEQTVEAAVDQSVLDAAIDAHVATPLPTPPDPIQMVSETKTDLQAQIDQLTDITLGI